MGRKRKQSFLKREIHKKTTIWIGVKVVRYMFLKIRKNWIDISRKEINMDDSKDCVFFIFASLQTNWIVFLARTTYYC